MRGRSGRGRSGRGRLARGRLLAIALVGVAGLAASPSPAKGHPLRFGVLHLREQPDGRVQVDFRFSGTEAEPAGVRVQLPERCAAEGDELQTALRYGEARRILVRCGPQGLAGSTVRVEGMQGRTVQTAVRIERPDGEIWTATLTPERPTFTVPQAGGSPSPLRTYLALGVRHILEGADHLLFVLGLLLLVGLRWGLVATLTSFTVGHSLTLALATLGYAQVPQAPVEAAIALSIVVLAVELARRDDAPHAPPGLTSRHPGLLAGLFGLLHGLGFAGVLAEVGLAEGHLVASLLGFNLGVELGQLVFVAVALAGLAIVRGLRPAPLPWARRLAVYALGTAGVFFFLSRFATFT